MYAICNSCINGALRFSLIANNTKWMFTCFTLNTSHSMGSVLHAGSPSKIPNVIAKVPVPTRDVLLVRFKGEFA